MRKGQLGRGRHEVGVHILLRPMAIDSCMLSLVIFVISRAELTNKLFCCCSMLQCNNFLLNMIFQLFVKLSDLHHTT